MSFEELQRLGLVIAMVTALKFLKGRTKGMSGSLTPCETFTYNCPDLLRYFFVYDLASS